MRAEKQEKKCRKTGKVIGIRWKFWQYDPNKRRNVVVPIAQVPQHIRLSQSEVEVDAYVNSRSAIEDAVRFRARQRVEWKSRYHDIADYLEKFGIFQKEKAANSWKNDVYFLEAYVFFWFLQTSGMNNLNEWHLKFDDFRDWLKQVKPLKYRKNSLAKNTQKNVIKSLNRFLEFAFKKNWIDQLRKCQGYSREETLVVTLDDIFRDDEKEEIFTSLNRVRPLSAELFWTLIHTGLRINEAIGLCADFVLQGSMDGPKSKHIHESLSLYSMGDYHGYLFLESQPVKGGVKQSISKIDRKPLKHRKAIGAGGARLIPIYDKKTWNILVDRCESAAAQLSEVTKNGAELLTSKDILLFQGLTAQLFYCDLTWVLKQLGLKHRSPHKCRHTFLTWFYPRIQENLSLAKTVAAHSDARDLARYNHFQEAIFQEMKLKSQNVGKLSKV